MEEKSDSKSSEKPEVSTPSKPSPASNKVIIIVAVVVIILCLVCSIVGFIAKIVLDKAEEKLTEEGVEEIIEKGTGTDFEFGGELPKDFPKDIKLMNGSKIITSSVTGELITVTLSVSENNSGQEIIDYYEDSLTSKGWTVDTKLDSYFYSISLSKGDKDVIVSVIDVSDSQETAYSIVVSPKSN